MPLAAALYAWYFFSELGVNTSPASAIIYDLGSYLGAVALFILALLQSDGGGAAPEADRALDVARLILVPLTAWGSFGVLVYPKVLPQFGGAAAHMVSLKLEPDAPADLHTAVEGAPRPLIDHDEQFVYLFACSRGPTEQSRTLAIPVRYIGSMSVAHQVGKGLPVVAVPELVGSPECTGAALQQSADAQWH